MQYGLSKKDCFRFAREMSACINQGGKPVFLCVGSDKFVCDSLAPIVAEKLRHEYNLDAYIYGGLDYNINANNLMEAVNYVETMHEDSPIVLIDATLDNEVGKIKLNGGAYAGLGRCLPIRKIGAISVLGIVGRKNADFNLNSTRLKLVIDMANFISLGCFLAVYHLNKLKSDKNPKKLTIFNY